MLYPSFRRRVRLKVLEPCRVILDGPSKSFIANIKYRVVVSNDILYPYPHFLALPPPQTSVLKRIE